jgi:hypothetical protein
MKLCKRTILASALLLMMTGLALAGKPRTFTNNTLSGTYIVALHGIQQPVPLPGSPEPLPPGPIQAIVGVGRLTFDGNGNITSGNIFVNSNGPIFSNSPTTGTYSVTSLGDCNINLVNLAAPLATDWLCSVDDLAGAHVHFASQGTDPTKFNIYDGDLTKQH